MFEITKVRIKQHSNWRICTVFIQKFIKRIKSTVIIEVLQRRLKSDWIFEILQSD